MNHFYMYIGIIFDLLNDFLYDTFGVFLIGKMIGIYYYYVLC